jgi:hypothetical protein
MASRKSDLRFRQLNPGLSTLADLAGLLEEHGDDGGSDGRRKAWSRFDKTVSAEIYGLGRPDLS